MFHNQVKKFSTAGLPSNVSLCSLVSFGVTSILVNFFIIIYDEGHSWGGNMPELHALPIITLLAALLAQWLCMPGRSRLLSAFICIIICIINIIGTIETSSWIPCGLLELKSISQATTNYLTTVLFHPHRHHHYNRLSHRAGQGSDDEIPFPKKSHPLHQKP